MFALDTSELTQQVHVANMPYRFDDPLLLF